MKTDEQLFKIFSEMFSEDMDTVNAAIREAKKAWSYIKKDKMYNDFSSFDDE